MTINGVYLNTSPIVQTDDGKGGSCIIRSFDSRTVQFSVAADDQPDGDTIICNDSTFRIARGAFTTLFEYCGRSSDGRTYRRATQ